MYRIDLGSGDRTLVTSIFTGPAGIAVESGGDIIVTDSNANRVFRVDPVTGNITVASGPNKGSGPAFGGLGSIVVEPTGQFVVIDGFRLMRVNAINGNRSVISGPAVGDGPGFPNVRDITVNQDGDLFVIDNNLPALFHVA